MFPGELGVMLMQYKVTTQIDGKDVLAGTLYQNVRYGQETASFSYDSSYLENPKAFSLAPDMPLGSGAFHSEGLKEFRALEDCMPDRWGRNLLFRAERSRAYREQQTPRVLFEIDYLTGVSDKTRQGAIRIWDETGQSLAPEEKGVPREVDLPALLNSADLAAVDMDADIRDLLEAGSSLGGARPKASVQDQQGTLWIAKFPKSDEDSISDISAWEKVSLDLMSECGINVPESRLIRIKGRSVLLLKRFDRVGDLRIPYISGLTAIQGNDGNNYSYLELVEFIEDAGSNPQEDIRELWRRALFSCAIGNTDNHMRNYGFLRSGLGWKLSPAFDVNPTEGSHAKYLSTGLDFGNRGADIEVALNMCEYYRVGASEAKNQMREMARALQSWRSKAHKQGISKASIDKMASCFDGGIEKLLVAAKR